MTTTPTQPRARRARLTWLVLVLLVGLLGMHGLASDHAVMAQADPMPASVAVTSHATRPATAMGTARSTAAGPLAEASVVVDQAVRASHDAPAEHGGMAMAGLCLAVLASALLLADRRRRRGLPVQSRADARVPGWPRSALRDLVLPRPPDLVAGLCVSRT